MSVMDRQTKKQTGHVVRGWEGGGSYGNILFIILEIFKHVQCKHGYHGGRVNTVRVISQLSTGEIKIFLNV